MRYLPLALVLFSFPAVAAPKLAPDAVVRQIYQKVEAADSIGAEWEKAKTAGDEAKEQALYEQYMQAQQHHPFWNVSERETYFTESLATLAREDRFYAGLHGTPEKLTYDPLSDSEEPSVAAATISSPLMDGKKASVRVGFSNWDQQKTLVYTLIEEGGKWKVDNIVSIRKDGTRGNDLRQVLTPAPSPTPAP